MSTRVRAVPWMSAGTAWTGRTENWKPVKMVQQHMFNVVALLGADEYCAAVFRINCTWWSWYRAVVNSWDNDDDYCFCKSISKLSARMQLFIRQSCKKHRLTNWLMCGLNDSSESSVTPRSRTVDDGWMSDPANVTWFFLSWYWRRWVVHGAPHSLSLPGSTSGG